MQRPVIAGHVIVETDDIAGDHEARTPRLRGADDVEAAIRAILACARKELEARFRGLARLQVQVARSRSRRSRTRDRAQKTVHEALGLLVAPTVAVGVALGMMAWGRSTRAQDHGRERDDQQGRA